MAKIERTDHPTFKEAVEGTLKALTPGFLRNRKEQIDKEVDKVAAEIEASKAKKDKELNITRRTA